MKRAIFRRASFSLLLAGLTGAVISGCQTRLEDKPITSLSASIEASDGMGPGQSSPLTIVARTSDGKELRTIGAGKGDVAFSSFTFTGTLVSVSASGMVTVAADPRLVEGHTPHLHITTAGHPDITADIDIPVRYDVALDAYFNGAGGNDGRPGRDGARGDNGSDGSANANGAGGDGSRGGNGGRGGDGEDGEPGQQVRVWLTVRPGARPMLQVRALSASAEGFYLIDPAGGSLAIYACGGAGGAGGQGGFGGIGGKGGDGSPGGRYGADGERGRPGRPGRGGAPGSITVWVDPKAEAYFQNLQLIVLSGDGDPGPEPAIIIANVPPLW